jgi:5-formyltetrahydrofolate cyclo-ligase
MLKKELRKKYNTLRLHLTATERTKFDDLLLIQFQQLTLPPLHNIMSFVPIEEKREVNTFIITDFLRFRNPGMQVCYPQTNIFQNTMQAIITDEDTEFDANEYGVPEPVQGTVLDPNALDAVLVPLLTFDKRGYRVGYGKGFYDRFLKDCRKDCIKIGLSYFEPVDLITDASGFDVPLNYCITPQTHYVF